VHYKPTPISSSSSSSSSLAITAVPIVEICIIIGKLARSSSSTCRDQIRHTVCVLVALCIVICYMQRNLYPNIGVAVPFVPATGTFYTLRAAVSSSVEMTRAGLNSD
jgi:hypothetical protein